MCSSDEDFERANRELKAHQHIRDPILAELVAIGEQQIQSHETVSHEDAKTRLSKWLD